MKDSSLQALQLFDQRREYPKLKQSFQWSTQLLLIDSLMQSVSPFQQNENNPAIFHCLPQVPILTSASVQQRKQEQSIQNQQADDIKAQKKVKNKQRQSKSKTGCKCKKTFCMKFYCQCYSSGGFCSDKCGCTDCKNNPKSTQFTQLLQNRIKEKQSHKCQCKKSKCQKNYCQCYSAGMSCGIHCKCTQCQNVQHYSVKNSRGSKEQKEQTNQHKHTQQIPKENEYEKFLF